jgi:hypothetical protein
VKAVVAAFYREPVLFLGALQAAVVALAAADVISPVISAVVVAVIVPCQRFFVTPDPSK